MQAVLTTNRWSCLPVAFINAMRILDENSVPASIDELIDFVGHDGSEILWPEEQAPNNRKGFADQEVIDYVWTKGFAVTQILALPYMACASEPENRYMVFDPDRAIRRIGGYLDSNVGVVCGKLVHSHIFHASAWTGKQLVEKNLTLDNILAERFYILTKRNS